MLCIPRAQQLSILRPIGQAALGRITGLLYCFGYKRHPVEMVSDALRRAKLNRAGKCIQARRADGSDTGTFPRGVPFNGITSIWGNRTTVELRRSGI